MSQSLQINLEYAHFDSEDAQLHFISNNQTWCEASSDANVVHKEPVSVRYNAKARRMRKHECLLNPQLHHRWRAQPANTFK